MILENLLEMEVNQSEEVSRLVETMEKVMHSVSIKLDVGE